MISNNDYIGDIIIERFINKVPLITPLSNSVDIRRGCDSANQRATQTK